MASKQRQCGHPGDEMQNRTVSRKQPQAGCQVGWSLLLLLVLSPATSFAQKVPAPPRTDPTLSRRISFEEARRLVENEEEGNLSRQTNRFSRTHLRSGQVVELYYPLAVVNRAQRRQRSTVPGYGIFYPSLAAFEESTRPRHMLEDLIPDGQTFLSQIPALIQRLEKRLRLAPGRLEATPAGLKRVDQFLRIYHATHTTAQTDPRLFQELTALYGETLRRAVGGEWRIDEERIGPTHRQAEPNISLTGGGATRTLKPWSSVIQALYDEDRRGAGLGRSLEADLASLATGR